MRRKFLERLKTRGPVFIVIAAVLWGVDGVLRRSLFSLQPIVIVFYEHLIGTVLIFPFLVSAWREEQSFTLREWLALFWVAILSGVLGTLWFTTALLEINFISFSVVFLLQKLQPVFAVGSAVVVLKEQVSRHYFLWSALAVIAAYFVTFPGGYVNFKTGSGTVIAALFALGAAFAWGSSTAFSRYALLRHSQTTITALRFLATFPLALLLVFPLAGAAQLGVITLPQLGTLLLIALSTGMVALWIYYRGLRYTETKISTILELVFPLTAVLIDILLYHHFLAGSQYLAAIVLLFAVYRVSKLNRPKNLLA